MSIRDEPDHRWETSALCAQTDPDVFHPEKGGSVLIAKRVCRACPVRRSCLTEALRVEVGMGDDARQGVFGGLSPRERWVLEQAGWTSADGLPAVKHAHLKDVA